MIEEEGTVIENYDNNTVEVAVNRREACKGCSAKGLCQPFGEGEEQMKVVALNLIGAQKGDKVIVAIPTSSFLKASFLVYLFPIILMLIGSFIGEIFFGKDIINFLSAGIFFMIGFFLVNKYSVKNRDKYYPILTKKLN